MTLHAFERNSNRSMKWVALPLELVDWMALHFSGRFIAHLASIDPYKDVLIPEDATRTAVQELTAVQSELESELDGSVNLEVPKTVDVFGDYGISGARSTVEQLIELLSFAKEHNCKVVSVGD